MTQLIRLGLLLLLLLLPTLVASPALAQGFTPGTSPGMGQPPKHTETPEGPAEAAPKEGKGAEPEMPALPPWPGQETRQVKLFDLHGYFRFRADLFHNLTLGMVDNARFKSPFWTPISEQPGSKLPCATRVNTAVPGGGDRDLESGDCPAKTLVSANMRLRLEPTINVKEKVRIYSQLDVFDNIVLGSTTDPNYVITDDGVLPFFSRTQAPPVVNKNSAKPGIVVKRAWAEVDLPVGATLRLGRMPVDWGLGMFANAGNMGSCAFEEGIEPRNCWDADFGDSADRILLQTVIGGFTLGMGYDFASTGPTSLSTQPGLMSFANQAIDLEQLDDASEWFWLVGRIDPQDVIRDRLFRGQPIFNYGLYLVWRKQDFDYQRNQGKVNLGVGTASETWAASFLERHAWTVTPDVWLRLMWRKLRIELEGAVIAGKIGNASDEIGGELPYDILQYGWAFRSSYRVLDNTLSFGLDMGMASGDPDEPQNADLNRLRWDPLGFNNGVNNNGTGDGSLIDRDGDLNEFRFHPNYYVDLILFREILGTVANATYFKPWIQYVLAQSLGARLDMIYSLANNPVGYPGNARNIGIELDVDIFYRSIEDDFYATLVYGVLFPFGALNRPADIFTDAFAADAKTAQTVQARVVIPF